jgi:hypothetical protein
MTTQSISFCMDLAKGTNTTANIAPASPRVSVVAQINIFTLPTALVYGFSSEAGTNRRDNITIIGFG